MTKSTEDQSSISPQEVSRFYDAYVNRQTVVGVNERHRRIMHWLEKAGLHAGSNVLEIGCGVGTQTGLIARRITSGRLLANDISPKSVEIARDRLGPRKNVDFIVGDIITLAVDGRFDLIVLPDVLEHIPRSHHGALFKKLAELLAPGGTIVAHIPAPQQIEWLQRHRPEQLQVIDQPIHLAELAPKLADAGLYLRFVEHYGLWTDGIDAAVLFIERYEQDVAFRIVQTKRSVADRVLGRLIKRPAAPGVHGAGRVGTEEAVLFVVDWWPTGADEHNGVFVREHALAVARHRKVVVVRVTLEKSSRLGITFNESHDGDLVVCDVLIHTPVRRFGLHDALIRRSYRRTLDDLRNRFRFRFAHLHVRTPATACFIQVAEERELPVIVTEHSSFYHRGIRLGQHGPHEVVREKIRRWFAHPSIVRVLPVSADLGRILSQEYGVPEQSLVVVPNVASTEFAPGEVETPPPFHIVLAARWSGPKDPLLFLEALDRLPAGVAEGLRIDWIGDGEHMDKVRERARELEKRQVVVNFHGYLPKGRLAEFVGRAHLLVHPTTAENLPCIIIESLACGTPVLSHAVNGIPELVDGTNGILCVPGDVEAFADALLKCVRGEIRFDRVAIAQAAVQRYSPDSVALRLLKVYDEVMTAERG